MAYKPQPVSPASLYRFRAYLSKRLKAPLHKHQWQSFNASVTFVERRGVVIESQPTERCTVPRCGAQR